MKMKAKESEHSVAFYVSELKGESTARLVALMSSRTPVSDPRYLFFCCVYRLFLSLALRVYGYISLQDVNGKQTLGHYFKDEERRSRQRL